MTVNEYISQKFQTFGIQLSEADLLDMCLASKISGEDEMSEDCQTRVSVAIAKFIPLFYFVLPQSVKAVFLCLGISKGLNSTILSSVNNTD